MNCGPVRATQTGRGLNLRVHEESTRPAGLAFRVNSHCPQVNSQRLFLLPAGKKLLIPSRPPLAADHLFFPLGRAIRA
jgi:hypothetical protein